MNGTPHATSEDYTHTPSEPASPSTSTSTVTSQSSSPSQTNRTGSNSGKSMSDQSTLSMASDHQLQPHQPISYNETLLKK